MEGSVSEYTDTVPSPLLLTRLFPDISVARRNKEYTGDTAQLSLTGLFSMTVIPHHYPFLSRITGNRTTNNEFCFFSQRRSISWINLRLWKFPLNVLSYSHCSPDLSFQSFSASVKNQLYNNCGYFSYLIKIKYI